MIITAYELLTILDEIITNCRIENKNGMELGYRRKREKRSVGKSMEEKGHFSLTV